MEFDIPDREGWVTGPLAKLPPCPPFPAFTDFEKQALNSIAALFEADADAFRQQIASARVIDRINTIVGFYTRVVVDRSKCRPLSIRYKGGHFDVEGVDRGITIGLWDDEGYLVQIVGIAYSEVPLAVVDLAGLRFIKLEQLGFPERRAPGL